jgi:hypothetical protein
MAVQSKSSYRFRRPLNMSEHEYARKLYDEYRNALNHDAKNFDRCMTNNRLYWAVDTDKGLGAIPSAVVAEMIRIGKQPGSYNICRPAVDNIVGGFLQAPMGFDFRPIDAEISSLTYASRDVIFSESELMDWSVADMEGDIDSCIYRSDYQMYIERHEFKDGPHTGLRTLPVGEVLWPPKLSSRHKERKKVYRRRMMTPMEALEVFSGGREKIIKAVMYKQYGEKALEELAKLIEQTGETYGVNSGVVPFSNNQQMWGSQYEFIMVYHMERVTREYEYVLTEDNDRMIIPTDLSRPEDPDEVKTQNKILWLDQNYPGWTADAVFADDEDINVQYMAVIAPSLADNMLICDCPTDEQCGMLSIVPRSAYFKGGEFGGLIDSIKDIQLSLNWIQNTLQYRLHVDGDGVAWYYYPEAFESPAECQRWIDCANKAGEKFALRAGMEQRFPNGPAIPVQKSPYPKEASDRLEQLLDKLLPLIGKYTPASRGQSESTSESGYLFNLKKLQNDVERKILFEGRKQFKNLLGEMWLGLAPNVHGNKIARKFFNPRTGKTFEVNKHVTETTPEGDTIEYIINDISKLKEIRHRVIIVESPDSPTRRAENMQVSSELLKGIQSTGVAAMVPESTVRLIHSMLRGAENLSEDEKREMEEGFARELEIARSSAEATIATNKANTMQAQMAMQPQVPQVPGAAGTQPGGGGMPSGVPGEGAPVETMQQEMAIA